MMRTGGTNISDSPALQELIIIHTNRKAAQSLHSLSLLKKGYRFVKIHKNNLVNWNALRPRGPSLFRSAGKGSKRGRIARHFGSGESETRPNPFGEPSQTQRLTAFQTHGKVRFFPCRARQGKNPLTSHAVRFCGRCLGLPTVLSGTSYENDQKPCFFVHFFLLSLIDKLRLCNRCTALT